MKTDYRMSERQPQIDFDGVSVVLVDVQTFAEARQRSRKFFSQLYLTLSDEDQNQFALCLYKWSNVKLHTRQQETRLAAIVGFSFYVDIDDDQSNYTGINQSLERILPIDDVFLIKGISRLFYKIARKMNAPFIPHLMDRIMSWLSFARDSRATPASIISSLFLLLRISPFDPLFYKKYVNQLNTITMTALTYPSKEIHQAVIELNRKIIATDPAANERVSKIISNVLCSFNNSNINNNNTENGTRNGMLIDSIISRNIHLHPQGFFSLLSYFFVDYKDVCEDKATDLFIAISDFIAKDPNEEYLAFLALLVETLPKDAETYASRIYSIFLTPSKLNFNNPGICIQFSRIARILPEHFCVFANNLSFGLIPRSPDSYFILIKVVMERMPNIIDRKYVLGVFSSSRWSSYLVDAAITFASTFSSDTFSFIHIFTEKVKEINELSLSFLARISFLEQFPLIQYWDTVYNYYNEVIPKDIELEINDSEKNLFPENSITSKSVKENKNDDNVNSSNANNNIDSNNDIISNNVSGNAGNKHFDDKAFGNETSSKQRAAAVLALTSILQRFKGSEQSTKLFSLLNQILIEDSLVKSAFLNSIDDSLLHYFTTSPNFVIIYQIFNDTHVSVALSALNLIKRIQAHYPISTLNFYFTLLHQFPKTFDQIPSKLEQVEYIKFLSILISAAGTFAFSICNELIVFLLDVLNKKTDSKPLSLSKTIEGLDDMRCYRQIRIHAMHCISNLASSNAHCQIELLDKVVNVLVDQLLLINSQKVKIAAAQTLRVLFRAYPLVKRLDSKGIVKLHQSLFMYIKNTSNSTAQCLSPEMYKELLKLFGTIGSLDPYEFHTFHTHTETEDMYPLYDRTKREQSYLNFVMKYILNQLKDNSKTHDLFVLINALVYIIQSDASKCFDFLEEVVNVFTTILDRPNVQIQLGELFPSFKTIVLVVDIEILPHAKKIYDMVLPYITKKFDVDALKLLNALIYSMKKNFVIYGSSTFALITSLLSEEQYTNIGSDAEITLMLTMTLLVIFAGGSPNIYFNVISQRALSKNTILTRNALSFLTQALRSAPLTSLILPSLRLGIKIYTECEASQEPAIHLIEVLVLRFPNVMTNLPLEQSWKEFVVKINTDPKFKKEAFSILQSYNPVPEQHAILSMPVMTILPLSQIFGRGRLQLSVSENDWNNWFLQLTQDLVLCSNSPAIRASHPLLRLSSDFEAQLFPFVIVSVWDIALDNDRKLLSNYLLGIVHSLQVTPDILSVIVAACDAMDRANFALFKDPFVSGQIAERCNSWFRSLRFFEKALSKSIEPTSHLLRINSLLKRKESALGLLNIAVSADSNCELLEALSMWSQARDVYEKKFNENPRNETFLAGYLNCSMFLEDWERIEKRVNDFSTYTNDMQPKVAMIFAAAMRNTGGDPSQFLQAIKTDDPTSCIWRAIVSLDRNNLEAAEKWVSRGLTLLSQDISSFTSGSYEPAIPAICTAMMFEELKDVTDQRKGLKTADEILKMWASKADYVKRDATQLRNVHRVRELLQCSKEQKFTIHIDFVDSLRKLKEWTLFDNSFRRLFSNHMNDERIRLMSAKSNFDRGMVRNLNEFKFIIDQLKDKKNKTDVYCDAILSYVSRSSIKPSVLSLLAKVTALQPQRVRAWKHWAYFNLGCAQPPVSSPSSSSSASLTSRTRSYSSKNIINDNITNNKPDNDINYASFASAAVEGFSMLIKLTGPSLHFLCQLSAIFFSYGDTLSNFEEIAYDLKRMDPSSVIQIIPQLMVQFDHPSEEVRKVVYEIIRIFSLKHFQALTMPFCLLKATTTSSKALLDFIDQLSHDHPVLMRDAEEFTKGLIQIAVTPIEEVIQLFERVTHLSEIDAPQEEIIPLFKKANSIIKGQKHSQFVTRIFNDVKIKNFVKNLSPLPTSSAEICRLANMAISIKKFLDMKIENMSTMDIAEMNFSLASASSFSLVVPGFYSVDKEPVTIHSIIHILKIIPSAKRPRKLRIIGSDGKTYKYLLKGREDLRLDQRVMQLFSLTNSILHDDKFGVERHLHIRQVPIVPIATNAGLIAWAEGGETIHSMILCHRRIVGVEIKEEQKYIKNYVGDEATIGCDREYTLRMSSIQKLELHRELCGLALDDDIRETLWLRSPNAELWLNATTNFARSSGLMSIIGYLIGMGDRHPSNILVMKGTGNVVHIDFSDIFEKASLRSYVHETVPFRLTRMIVRALGASGIHGVFDMTAEYVMTLMRRNKETLLAFLDIFIQDPITDTIWYKNAASTPPPPPTINSPGAHDSSTPNSNSESSSHEINIENKTNENNNNNNHFPPYYHINEGSATLRKAISRVSDKLNGREFDGKLLTEHEQVSTLIEIATNEMNLAQMYYGWSPFW